MTAPAGEQVSVYEAAGGAPAMLTLAHAWHQRCLADPEAGIRSVIRACIRSTPNGWPPTGARCWAGPMRTPGNLVPDDLILPAVVVGRPGRGALTAHG